MAEHNSQPWYAGQHQDALFYLLIAIFFIELIVGGIAFFYGIIHAAPEVAGGPPVVRFPWLAWALSAVLAPVGLLLIVHLAGTWVSHILQRDAANIDTSTGVPGQDHLPDGMKRFYASVRHAPTLVLLVGILLLGAGVFFIDGALGVVMEMGKALIPYIPWIAGSLASLLALCFLVHAIMVYRQRKMEQEYAWRREVLEKTGLVLVDKSAVGLPTSSNQQALIAPESLRLEHGVLDVESRALPSGDNQKTSDSESSEQKQ